MNRLAFVLTAVLLAATVTPRAAAQDIEDDPAAMADLAEQIEIMKLVLASSINERYDHMVRRMPPDDAGARDAGDDPAPERQSQNVVTPDGDPALATYESALLALRFAEARQDPGLVDAPSIYTSHTRGFYAQDLGVLFTTEVTTPVRAVVSPEPDADPDEWDAAARRVRGTSHAARSRRQLISADFDLARTSTEAASWEIDPEFVDAAITTVLATLGKYGHKLEALPDEERLVVALRLAPGRATALRSSRRHDIATTLFDASYQAARPVAAVHLVIEIDKRDVKRASGRSASELVRTLREEAKITSY